MQYSIIQKSQLEGAKRLDAEYYQPEFLDMEKKIKKFKNYLLKDLIVNFVTGKNLKQVNYSKKLVNFVRTQNVRPVLIDKIKLSSLDPNEKRFYKLSEGDILFVRVGEGVGNSSITTPEFVGSTISDNVISVKVDKINPYFISIFLNSKFGYLYWDRVSKGTARALVSSENINAIRIPCLDKKMNDICKNSIIKSSELISECENIYKQAEDLLLEELGLKDFEGKNKFSSVVNLSEILEARRMDAEYFQPKYKNLIEHIRKNCGGVYLGELVGVKKGIEPGAESYCEAPDETTITPQPPLSGGQSIPPALLSKGGVRQFIRVSSMSKYGINDNDQKYLSEDLYNELKKDYEPQVGEILLTKDASPGIAYVLKSNIEGIISGGVLRLKLKDKNIEDEYLALCLNSIVGQMQAERDVGGSVIMHWKPEQIKNVVIPILPKQTQQKISSLIRESFDKRKKAKELLEEAKRRVEEMIEKN